METKYTKNMLYSLKNRYDTLQEIYLDTKSEDDSTVRTWITWITEE